MQNRYAWLSLALLAFQLAACSSDYSDGKASRSGEEFQSPNTIDSGVRPGKDGTGQGPVGLSIGLGKASQRLTAADDAGVVTRRLRAAPVRPTTLTDATADTIRDSLNGAETSIEAGEDRQADLSKFLALGLPAAQEFTVRPGRDTLLIGRQGTQLFVPADAWDVPLTGAPVRLQLREFYSTPDIISAGLSTRAGSELLETGGMLSLTATSKTGVPVSLRREARLIMQMPTAAVKPGMQLFQGVHAGAIVDWQASDSIAASGGMSFDVVALYRRKRRETNVSFNSGSAVFRWPVYLQEAWQQRGLARSARYSPETITQLCNALKLSGQEQASLGIYNQFATEYKRPLAKRMAEVEFRVDTMGVMSQTAICEGYDAELASPVLAEMKRWQQWKPAFFSQNNQYPWHFKRQTAIKVGVVGIVRVIVLSTGKVLVGPPDWDLGKSGNGLVGYLSKRRMQAYRARIAHNATMPAVAHRLTSADLYYELSSMSMGWINCDRFIDSTQPRLDFTVAMDNVRNAQYSLVFRDTRTIIDGKANKSGEVGFGRLPVATEGTIVAMYWKQGNAFLAIHPIKVSAALQAEILQYEPVTISELQTALSKLE